MPRFTIYRKDPMQITASSKLHMKLHTVLHTAGIPEGNGVVSCVQMDTTSANKCLTRFCDEPFVELVCGPCYVPRLLKAMQDLKVYPDLEIASLGPLFITGKEIKTAHWCKILRKRLHQKSFPARSANVFLLDNLELFCSQQVMTPEYKEKILLSAYGVMMEGNIIQVGALRKVIAPRDVNFRADFLEDLVSNLDQLAILAGIG